jgi:hypothetical protein
MDNSHLLLLNHVNSFENGHNSHVEEEENQDILLLYEKLLNNYIFRENDSYLLDRTAIKIRNKLPFSITQINFRAQFHMMNCDPI